MWKEDVSETQVPPIIVPSIVRNGKDQTTNNLKPVERSCHKKWLCAIRNITTLYQRSQRSYHTECPCEIWELKLILFKSYWPDLILGSLQV